MIKKYRIQVQSDREINQPIQEVWVDSKAGGVHLQAQANRTYVLHELTAQGLVPIQRMRAQRVGHHLHLYLGDADEAELIIDGYFDPSLVETQFVSTTAPESGLADYDLALTEEAGLVAVVASVPEMNAAGLNAIPAAEGLATHVLGIGSTSTLALVQVDGDTPQKESPAPFADALQAVKGASASLVQAVDALEKAKAALGDAPSVNQIAQVEALQVAVTNAAQLVSASVAALREVITSAPDASEVTSGNAVADEAQALLTRANAAVLASEVVTDQRLAEAGDAAQVASEAATQATNQAMQIQEDLSQAIQALRDAGASATQYQIQTVKTLQAQAMAAQQDCVKFANAALTASNKAHNLAVAAHESDPQGLSQANIASTSASAAAEAANASVLAGDAQLQQVLALSSRAAQLSAQACESAFVRVEKAMAKLNQLKVAVAEAGQLSTPEQLKALDDLQAEVQSAAQVTADKLSIASRAVNAAHQTRRAIGGLDSLDMVQAQAVVDRVGLALPQVQGVVNASEQVSDQALVAMADNTRLLSNAAQVAADALQLAQQQLANLKQALVDAGDAVTAEQLHALEQQQELVSVRAQSTSHQAALAHAAAAKLHMAAVAAAEATSEGVGSPAAVAQAQQAADQANRAAQDASEASLTSEVVSDQLIISLQTHAQSTAQDAQQANQEALDAVNALNEAMAVLVAAGLNATAAQIEDLTLKQSAATASAAAANTKASQLNVATNQAHALALAAGEDDATAALAVRKIISTAASQTQNATDAVALASQRMADLVDALGQVAERTAIAAEDANAALAEAVEKLNALKAQTIASAAQIQAIEDQQTVVQDLSQSASDQAQAALAAADAAHVAAQAVGVVDPSGVEHAKNIVTQIGAAIENALEVVFDAPHGSEARTDAAVAAAGVLAQEAASQVDVALEAVRLANADLVNALTLDQLKAAQTALRAAAFDAADRAALAAAAAAAAHQAAVAAREEDPIGVGLALAAQTDASQAAQASALAVLVSAAQANNADALNASLSLYQLAGVTGIDETHVAAINSALNSAAVSGNDVATLAKLQAVADGFKAILSGGKPTHADYLAMGVTGVDGEVELKLLGDVIATKLDQEVNSTAEVQALAQAVQAVLTYTGSQMAPDLAQLDMLVGGVTLGNLMVVQRALAAANTQQTITSLSALQTVVKQAVDTYDAALQSIQTAANNNTTPLAQEVFANAGISGVNATNLAAINAALASDSVTSERVGSTAAIQQLVNAYQKLLTSASLASTDTYVAIGASIGQAASNSENLSLLNDMVAHQNASGLDSISKVNRLARIANAIADWVDGGAAALTVDDWHLIGLSDVNQGNIDAFKVLLGAQPDQGTTTASLAGLQTLLSRLNDSVGAIRNAATLNSSEQDLDTAVFQAAGLEGVNDSNFPLIQKFLDSSSIQGDSIRTAKGIQDLINAVTTLHALTDGANNDAPSLNTAHIQSLGLVDVINTDDDLTLFNDVMDNARLSQANTAAHVSGLAQVTDRLVKALRGETLSSSLTSDDFLQMNLSGVSDANLADVVSFLASSVASEKPFTSLQSLQNLIDTFNWQQSSPTLSLPEGINGVNLLELSDGLNLEVHLPDAAQVGDVLKVMLIGPNQQSETFNHTLTVLNLADAQAGHAIKVHLSTDVANASDQYTIRSHLVRSLDEVESDSVELNFHLDVDAPELTVNLVAGDEVNETNPVGVLTALEKTDAVNGTQPISISGLTDAEIGQVVTLVLNGHRYVGDVMQGQPGGNNIWAVNVNSDDLVTLNHGNTYALHVSVSDAAGNVTHVNDRSLRVDTTSAYAPTVREVFANTTLPTLRGQMKKDDGNATAVGLSDGDRVTFSIEGQSLTVEIGVPFDGFAYDPSTGDWELDTSKTDLQPFSVGTHDVEVTVQVGQSSVMDASRNELHISLEVPRLTLSEVTGDDGVDAFESTQELVLAGETDVAVGTEVRVRIANEEFSTQVVEDELGQRHYLLFTDRSSLSFAQNGKINIEVNVVNGYGNSKTVTREVMVDALAPGRMPDGSRGEHAAPALAIAQAVSGVSAAELSAGVEVSVTLPTGTVQTDEVFLTILDSQGILYAQTYALTADDVQANLLSIVLAANVFGYDDTYRIVAATRDQVGNASEESAEVSFRLDTLAPGQRFNRDTDAVENGEVPQPVMVIAQGAGGIAAQELKDGLEINLTLPTGSEAGDVLVFSVRDPSGDVKELSYRVSPLEASESTVRLRLPTDLLSEDGQYRVSVYSQDVAGNMGQTSEAEFSLVASLSLLTDAAQYNKAGQETTGVALYQAAGVAAVTNTNVSLINDVANTLSIRGENFDSVSEINAIALAASAILNKANGASDDALIAKPMAADYTLLGITGVQSAAHVSLLGDVLGTQAASGVQTVSQIQSLANVVAQLVNSDSPGEGLSVEQWGRLVEGVTADNLFVVNQALLVANSDGTPIATLSDLHLMVSDAFEQYQGALDWIKSAADGNLASDTDELTRVCALLGITNLTELNQDAVIDALNSSAVTATQVSSVSNVQALITAYQRVLDKANGAASDEGLINPTASQYVAIGVTGVQTTAQVNLLGDVIGSKVVAEVDRVQELQALADAVVTTVGYQVGSTRPTSAQLNLLVSHVTQDNYDYVLRAIASAHAKGEQVATQAALQKLVTQGQVLRLGDQADAAATAANEAAQIVTDAKRDWLDAALAMAQPATAQQVAALDAKKLLLLSAANDAHAKAQLARAAADAAHDAAVAAGQADPAGVEKANQAASKAISAATAQTAPVIVGVESPVAAISELADAQSQDFASIQGRLFVVDLDLQTSDGISTLSASSGAAQVHWSGGTLPNGVDLSALTTHAALTFVGNPLSNGLSNSIDWQYDPTAVNLDWLGEGQVLTLTYAITVSDGINASQAKNLVIRITGQNDAAVISGDIRKTLIETDAVQTVEGVLRITDVDSAASFVSQSSVAGRNGYGTFSMDTLGGWRYSLSSAQNQFAAGQIYTDSFLAQSSDGTVQEVVVSLNGSNDAPVLALPENRAPLTWSQGDAALSLFSSDLNIADADSGASVASATLALGGVMPGDQLLINGSALTSGATGTVLGLTYRTTDSDGRIDIQFNGAADATTYKAALQTLAFVSASQSPDGTRTLDLSLNDGLASSNLLRQSVQLINVNDQPIALLSEVTLAGVAEDTFNAPGETVGELFAAAFEDADTRQHLSGVLVVGHGATANQGQWQWFNGSTWLNLSTDLSGGAAVWLDSQVKIRFAPAGDFNGAPSALRVRLADSSIRALTTGSLYDIGQIGWEGATDSLSKGVVELTTHVTPVNDSPTGEIRIAGDFLVGQTLSILNTLADPEGMGTLRYQWYASGQAIQGAVGDTYLLSAQEVGKTITVSISYLDGTAHLEQVSSAATPEVQDLAPSDAPELLLGAGVANGATSAEATAQSGVVTVLAEIGLRTVVTFVCGGQTLQKTVLGNGTTAVAVTLTEEDLTYLGNGSVRVQAQTIGITGTPSQTATITWTLDTFAPVAPMVQDITGVDNTVNRSEATAGFLISGTGEAGATIVATFSSGHVLQGGNRALVAANGAWHLSLTEADVIAMGQGAETLTLDQSDLAGNVYLAAVQRSFSIDTSEPIGLGTPTLTTTGDHVVSNAINNSTTALSFSALVGAGEAVGGHADFYINGVLIGSDAQILDSDTRVNWQTDTTTAAQLQSLIPTGGLISVRLYDAAGNMVSANGEVLMRDVLSPTILRDLSITPKGGNVLANTLNGSNTSLTLAASIGVGEATGGRAEFYMGGVWVGTSALITASDSKVSFTTVGSTPADLQRAVPVGGIFSVKLYDATGNLLTANGIALVRDVAPPEALTPTLAVDSGLSATDFVTNQAMINVTGLIEPGARWQYSINGGSTWVNGVGSSFVLTPGAYVANAIQVHQIDSAGNVGLAGVIPSAVKLDTTLPIATLTSSGTLGTLGSAKVQSSEIGTAYLVDRSINVNSEAEILALANERFNSVTITTAATTYTISLAGLIGGDYMLYTADKAGNLSLASTTSLNVVESVLPLNLKNIGQAVGSGGFVINGALASDNNGYSVANAGDVNGDGYMDVIVSSPGSASKTGKSYVVFGKTNQTAVNLSVLGSEGFVINAQSSADQNGYSVSAAGDLNGDGLSDLLISARSANGSAGRTYVVFGKNNTTAVNLSALAALTPTGGFVIHGQAATDYSGSSVAAAGDVNGDGIGDLLIGAIAADPSAIADAGRSYVVFGKTDMSAIQLSAIAQSSGLGGFVINGQSTLDHSGVSVSSAGDVNGDGLADLIVGANQADTPNGINVGKSYVVFGKTDTFEINLSNVVAGSGGFVIKGESANDYCGYSVSNGGDINGDGLADLIVGADQATVQGINFAGKTYVVFGQTHGDAVNLSAVARGSGGFVINGDFLWGWSGNSVSSAGDLNGDGLMDVILGASKDSGSTLGGRSYVIFGKTDTAAINASALREGVGGFVINGQSSSDAAGHAVSAAGDINGDGFSDLIVGAIDADPSGRSKAGSSYVIFGGTQFVQVLNPVDFVGSATSETFTGTAASETFMAGDGADTIMGHGGGDVMNGGKGNDTFVLNSSNITALGRVYGVGGNVGQLARVDGGTGFDTLRLSDGASLDLTTITNLDAVAGDGLSRINSIECLDLSTDTAANAVTLAGRDVTDMAGFNVIHLGGVSADGNTWLNVDGSTALSAVTKFHQLLVEGAAQDLVTFAPDGGHWVNVGGVSNGANVYTVYQNTFMHAQVFVRSGTQVMNNDAVLPVVIDLNRDGVLGYGQVSMDVNGDGWRDITKWAGAQDGVLVWDKYKDGVVHDNSQYAFAQYATTSAAGSARATDLSGLADAFDSNQDGIFDAADAKFAEFQVWQDINQNGQSEVGEVRSLLDWGMTCIYLTSDNIVRTPTAGVTEAGRTTAMATDGTSVLVADVGFEFTDAHSAHLATHDAQTVKLSLRDVLSNDAASTSAVQAWSGVDTDARSAIHCPQGAGWTQLLELHTAMP